MTGPDALLPDSFVLAALTMTEATAIAAAAHRGRGDETAAREAASQTMRDRLKDLEADARIALGETDSDDESLAPGTRTGRDGLQMDIALKPLEGATLCAKALPNALSAVVMGQPDSILSVPDVYMAKIAVGPGYPDGIIDLDAPVAENLDALAREKGVRVADITACVLDRPRHTSLIGELRETGAAVRLISDGDIAAIMETARAEKTGLDLYMGMGGAPEGIIAAAALRCMGGQMQARLSPQGNDQREHVAASGLDPGRKYSAEELVSGDIVFSATGISGGALLQGVLASGDGIRTHSLAMHGAPGRVRWVSTHHRRHLNGQSDG